MHLSNDVSVLPFGKIGLGVLWLNQLSTNGKYHLSTCGSKTEISKDEAILLVRCTKAHAKELYENALKQELQRLNKIIDDLESRQSSHVKRIID